MEDETKNIRWELVSWSILKRIEWSPIKKKNKKKKKGLKSKIEDAMPFAIYELLARRVRQKKKKGPFKPVCRRKHPSSNGS